MFLRIPRNVPLGEWDELRQQTATEGVVIIHHRPLLCSVQGFHSDIACRWHTGTLNGIRVWCLGATWNLPFTVIVGHKIKFMRPNWYPWFYIYLLMEKLKFNFAFPTHWNCPRCRCYVTSLNDSPWMGLHVCAGLECGHCRTDIIMDAQYICRSTMTTLGWPDAVVEKLFHGRLSWWNIFNFIKRITVKRDICAGVEERLAMTKTGLYPMLGEP